MIDLIKLTEDLRAYLKEKGYTLYHLEYKKVKSDNILTVEIDNHLDLNQISEVSRLVSEYMDELDCIDDAYLLDVCTVGLERILRGHEAIKNAEGEYVFIKLRHEIDSLKEVTGTIKSVSDDELVLSYMKKNIKKEMTIKEVDIKLIRLAIKF